MTVFITFLFIIKLREMEFWDGRDWSAPLNPRSRSVPGWSPSHRYPSRTPAPPCPESRSDYQGWMGEPSSWTIPGSRTGGTLRDLNWTDMIPSSNCPDESVHCPEGLAGHGVQERGLERQRALLERHRERERLVQSGQLADRWQTGSATLDRRAREKMSANSHRELEAWANRYYHSLPRQRRIEAETWNTTQSLPESERVSRSAGRLVSPQLHPRTSQNTAAPYSHERGSLNLRLRAQLEAWKTQQLPPYVPAKQSLFRRNTLLNPSLNQPPDYLSPPPYRGPQDSGILQIPQKCITKVTTEPVMEYRVESRPASSPFPLLRRLEHFVPLTEGRQHTDHPASEEIPRTLTYQKPETVTPQPSPPQHSEDRRTSCMNETLTRQSKPRRPRGGETVFCLVSRMGELAGVSHSPEEPLKSHLLPLLNVSAPGGPADVVKQSCERPARRLTAVQLADEVDSESFMSSKAVSSPDGHKGDGRAKPANQTLKDQEAANKEKLPKEIQEMSSEHTKRRSFQLGKEEEEEEEEPETIFSCKEEENMGGSSTTASPQVTESRETPYSRTTVKFPLWKEPKWHYRSKSVLEKKSEENQGSGNASQKDGAADEQPRKADGRESIKTVRDRNRGLVVIDATCVVVKVELIFPPEKKRVQYIRSHSTAHSQTEKSPLSDSSQEVHVQIREQSDDDLRCPEHNSSDIIIRDPIQTSKEVISESQTVEERAERILGITLHSSSREGPSQDDLLQTSHTKYVQTIQEEPRASSEAEVGRVGETEWWCETETEGIVREEPSLMTDPDGTLEESEMSLMKRIATSEVKAMDITDQEDVGTSEDGKTSLEEDLTSKQTEARADPDTDTNNLLLSFVDFFSPTGSPGEGSLPVNNLCPPLSDDWVEGPSEIFDQEGSLSEGILSEDTQDQDLPEGADNVCPVLSGKFGENTNESIGRGDGSTEADVERGSEVLDQEDVPDLSDRNDDVGKIDSPPLGDSEERPAELSGHKGDLPDENTQDPCPTPLSPHPESNTVMLSKGTTSRETDRAEDISPHLDGVEGSCQRFGQEGRIKDEVSRKGNDLQGLCPPIIGSSEKDTGDQTGKPEEGTPPDQQGDANTVCQLLPPDSSELFGEHGPMEGIFSDETGGINVFGIELSDQAGVEDDVEISVPDLHLPTRIEEKSPPQSPLTCLSPQWSDESSSFGPSLLDSACSSRHPDHQPESPSPPWSEPEVSPQAPPAPVLPDSITPYSSLLSPVLLAHSQPPESSSQSGRTHGEISSPSSWKALYPKSLRDAVNRIRKHTAPDSENEEEDGVDLWEQPSVQPEEVFMASDWEVEEEGQSAEEVRTADRSESSSSLESHDSNDTVIEGKEDIRETHEKNETNEDFHLRDENEGISGGEMGVAGGPGGGRVSEAVRETMKGSD